MGVLAMLAALVVGCYELRGGSVSADAAIRDVADGSDDVRSPIDVGAEDGHSAMDALDDVVDAVVIADVPDTGVVDAADVSEDGVGDVAAPHDGMDVPMDTGPAPCPAGLTRCGDTCVDTAVAPAHCGTCGTACPARMNAMPVCAAGRCGSLCNAGSADCDGDASNGCEAALDRAENCGACGMRCSGATPLCQDNGGRYGCVSGCSGAASTRCTMSCVDAQTDVQHCGACDRACSVPMNGRATCAAGSCGFACNTGFHACGMACADDTSVATCGARCEPCPARANATATCAMGACGFTCNTGFADCDGDASNGCEVDTRTTVAHCGMCARACATPANATPTCAMGTCGFMCNAGFADCDGNPGNGCEADLGSPGSCGRCGTRCMEPTPLCQEAGGQHACVSGCSGMASTRCAMSCVDAQTDVQHCGACDRACTVPMNGRATCAAGSCGFACNAGFHACGTACVDDTLVATCGARCEPCPARANATATCAAGACGFTCNAGFADCDGDASNGCEVDTRTNTAHCGMCGRACPASGCNAGVCGLPPTATQRSCAAPGTPGCGLVSIQGGTFTQGAVTPASDATPTQPGVTVGDFALDAYEVTVARFNAFWAARPASLSAVRSVSIAYPGGQSIDWGVAARDPECRRQPRSVAD